MTLNEIKAMFQPGQVWVGKRTPGHKHEACTVTERTIYQVRGVDVIYEINGKKNYHSDWPRVRDVIEAKPGYLRFHVASCKGERIGAEVELTRKQGAV